MVSKLNFLDKKVRRLYETLIHTEDYVDIILDKIMLGYNSVTLMDVKPNDDIGFYVIVKADDDIISLNTNLKNNTTKLLCPNWEYAIIYSNSLRKDGMPIGILYEKNNKSVLKCHSIDKTSKYKFNIDNRSYEILISDCDARTDDRKFINKLLNVSEIEGLLDIYTITKTYLNIDNNSLKIKRNDENDYGSMLIVSYNEIRKYVEYFDDGYTKFFYNEGKIYEEVTKKLPEIEDKYKIYIKKIGD